MVGALIMLASGRAPDLAGGHDGGSARRDARAGRELFGGHSQACGAGRRALTQSFTCLVLSAENEDRATAFLARHDDMHSMTRLEVDECAFATWFLPPDGARRCEVRYGRRHATGAA
jgi:hypothetical protein